MFPEFLPELQKPTRALKLYVKSLILDANMFRTARTDEGLNIQAESSIPGVWRPPGGVTINVECMFKVNKCQIIPL